MSSAAVECENARFLANVDVRMHAKDAVLPKRRKRCLTVDVDDGCCDTVAAADPVDAWWKVEYTLPPSGHLGAHKTIQPKDKHDDASRRALFEATHDGAIQIDSAIEIEATTDGPSSSSSSTRPLKKRKSMRNSTATTQDGARPSIVVYAARHRRLST
ncbi:Aste57867_12436 [Aphanomyces stellatus]|uniref:Aste57867_12436 protein n=1 Tax=Aphanomyces stellatus TaxID=120398 RepID=A0A485KVL7_9STRA|nr:hypothetical protein As57867_012390 [Aphanomyces stellatus]VFT89287.1 Aste57867_12436 [Aphanomyces stellatus]